MKLPYYPYCAGLGKVLPTLAASSCVLVAHSAELEFSVLASSDNFSLGSDFALVGDINDDGTPDLAVSDPNYSGDGLLGSGIVYLLSGASGEILLDLTGTPSVQQFFGSSLATLDANGDGVTDLAVGAPGRSVGSGAIIVYSGVDFSTLLEVDGSTRSQFGTSLASAGDQNGDGKDDLFVGAPQANSSLGAVDLISGADGSVLWSVGAEQGATSFGLTLATVGDFDGDNKADLAVAAPNHRDGTAPVGMVSLFRSSDQGIAGSALGNGFYNLLGYSMKSVEDANGDDIQDLMIGSFSGGNCYVVSGSDLSTIVDLSIPELPDFQPLVAGGSVDGNGDGEADWLLGSRGFGAGDTGPIGGFRLVSGADGSLLIDELADQPVTGLGQSIRALPGFGFAVGEPSRLDPETGGRGAAQFWSVEEAVSSDLDGDGVLDADDAVPESNMSPTLVILGCDTGIENRLEPDGTTLADRFDALPDPDELERRRHYIRHSTRLICELLKADLISRREARTIFRTTFKALLRDRCSHSRR